MASRLHSANFLAHSTELSFWKYLIRTNSFKLEYILTRTNVWNFMVSCLQCSIQNFLRNAIVVPSVLRAGFWMASALMYSSCTVQCSKLLWVDCTSTFKTLWPGGRMPGTARYSAEKTHYVLYFRKAGASRMIEYDTEGDHLATTWRPVGWPVGGPLVDH